MSDIAITRARENDNRHPPGDGAPALPLMELRQIVRPHQPQEPDMGIALLQPRDCVDGVNGAQPLFDCADPDRRAPRHRARRCQAGIERRHARPGFEWVLRAHQPPDLVEPEPPQRFEGEMAMAAMGRVERSAEQPDGAGPAAQGRTCPVPRTRYFIVVNPSSATGPRV
jgi:hypothetical protein